VAQESINRIWDELLVILESILVPPLYGPIEKERRIQNVRQLTLVDYMINILQMFFHADGQGLGISVEVLEDEQFKNVKNVLTRYQTDLPRLKRECELGIESGRNKDVILRLARLFIEKETSISNEERESHRLWLDRMLMKRKEIQKKSS